MRAPLVFIRFRSAGGELSAAVPLPKLLLRRLSSKWPPVASPPFKASKTCPKPHATPAARDPGLYDWVELPGRTKTAPGLFVAQVLGESMSRRIPNGAWCVWRANPAGSREGKVVLAQHRDIHDPDTGGQYTVKLYSSEKTHDRDGSREHLRVFLKPDSHDAMLTGFSLRAYETKVQRLETIRGATTRNCMPRSAASGPGQLSAHLLDHAVVLAPVTAADRGICRAIRTQRSGYYGQVDISFDVQAAAPYLIGHPLVFRRGTGESLRVTAARPRLEITAKGPDWEVRLVCPPSYAIHAQQLEVLQFNVCERGLLAGLGKGLLVPPAGQGRLYNILRDLSGQFLGELPPDPDRHLAAELGRALRGTE